MFKVLKKILDVICILFIIVLAIYAFLRFTNKAIIYEVKTGSMEDGIHAGDYILVIKKNNYKVGDIVTYKQGEYFVTHRIIKKNGSRVVTKGDANNIEDGEISLSKIVGEVVYSGGFLGFLVNYKYVLAAFMLALYLFSYYFDKKGESNYNEADLAFNEEEKALTQNDISEEENKEVSDELNDNLEENDIKLEDLFKGTKKKKK